MTTETLMTQAAPDNANQGAGGSSSQVVDKPAEGDKPTGDQAAAQQQQAEAGKTGEDGKNPTDAGKTEADAGKKDGEQPAGAPEKYEFKAPEGVTVDAQTLTVFSEVAKELNLPQDAAQKVIDKVAPAMAQRQADAIAAARTEWATASQDDKEFGGEKLTENLGVAKRAMDTFGTPELRALLEGSGLGNHPEVIRFMYRAGKAMSEDTFVTAGGSKGAAPQSTAQRMYPNMNP